GSWRMSLRGPVRRVDPVRSSLHRTVGHPASAIPPFAIHHPPSGLCISPGVAGLDRSCTIKTSGRGGGARPGAAGWGPGRMSIEERSVVTDRQPGPVSKVVGLYQTFLRRSLEHFFPDGVLDAVGDRSYIDWDGPTAAEHQRVEDDPEGLG